MIRHLLKLVWNRRRANLLVMVEIFFSFLVVFVVATAAVVLWRNHRRPLGFDSHDVWRVAIDVGQKSDDEFTAAQVATFAQVLHEARTLDRVQAVGGALTSPYSEASSETELEGRDGSRVPVEIDEVTDGLGDALDLEVVEGRWFDAADDGLAWQPVVIDRELARALFGDDDPLGRWIDKPPEPGDADAYQRRRVVGVVSDFRQHGELSLPKAHMLERQRVGDPRMRPPRNLLLEMAPETPAEYEEVLVRRLQAVAPEWSFEVRSLEEMRVSAFRLRLVPLVVGGVVAGFLLVMVALGLIGVLWQNVVRRTREIGLRRAAGAARSDVRRQILMELALVTSLGVALGVVLVAQLPVLDPFGILTPGVFAAGLVLSLALIYALAAVCALYPGWMAARVQPAEALRWE